MPTRIHNIHDKFVRETFSNQARGRAFLDKMLPSELREVLTLDDLKATKDS